MNGIVERATVETATESFLDFFHQAKDYRIIFFKTATNGLPPRDPSVPLPSILCVSALKGEIQSKRTITELGRYDRFYYAREGRYSLNAIREKRIEQRNYPL
jgi:hypothetical protein